MQHTLPTRLVCRYVLLLAQVSPLYSKSSDKFDMDSYIICMQHSLPIRLVCSYVLLLAQVSLCTLNVMNKIRHMTSTKEAVNHSKWIRRLKFRDMVPCEDGSAILPSTSSLLMSFPLSMPYESSSWKGVPSNPPSYPVIINYMIWTNIYPDRKR